MGEQFQKGILFIGLAMGIYCCYIVSAIYHEKMYHNLLHIASSSPTPIFKHVKSDIVRNPLFFASFPPCTASSSAG